MLSITLRSGKRQMGKVPDAPGVYFFLGPRRKMLYIGKAASLRDRVRSYFSRDVAEARSPAVAGMVGKAVRLAWQRTDSVLEALILEANLIKKHQPSFNIEQKDDKSWNYALITNELFPRILLVRGRELARGALSEKSGFAKSTYVFGPYPHGGQLKEALRIIRKIFPYRDTCIPGSGKSCFSRQVDLCPGVCDGAMGAKEYIRTVRNIRDIFGGNMKGVKRRLASEMRTAAKTEEYERATVLRRQVEALDHIRDVALIKGELCGASFFGGRAASRIEAYDIAHTAGRETVGVMAVVEGGESAKSEYRMFKVRSAANNDVAALKEVLARRLAHSEWRLPRLIVIDGGKAQLNAAKKTLERVGVVIPVVSVVKDEFHRPKGLIGNFNNADERSILLANHEAHRFALRFHRRRRGRIA